MPCWVGARLEIGHRSPAALEALCLLMGGVGWGVGVGRSVRRRSAAAASRRNHNDDLDQRLGIGPPQRPPPGPGLSEIVIHRSRESVAWAVLINPLGRALLASGLSDERSSRAQAKSPLAPSLLPASRPSFCAVPHACVDIGAHTQAGPQPSQGIPRSTGRGRVRWAGFGRV